VTIGAGSGGVRASRLAAGQYGAKVIYALIDQPAELCSKQIALVWLAAALRHRKCTTQIARSRPTRPAGPSWLSEQRHHRHRLPRHRATTNQFACSLPAHHRWP
jgi:hypothetical protein